MYKWSIVLLLVLASNARAQVLPSQVDLRAAYCIPLLQYAVSEIEHIASLLRDNAQLFTPEHQAVGRAVSEKTLSKTATNLRRLQLYLLPRLPYLAAYGIVAAKKSGEEDYARLKEDAKACDTKCNNAFANNSSAALSCTLQCNSDSPVRARMSICEDLSWLPF